MVVAGYGAALLVLVLIIDYFLMPAIVHSNEKVKVPNVVGKKLDLAELELRRFDLSSEISREIYSEKIPAGNVISQTPNARAEVKAGRPIFLVVSKGKETVPVPYMIGSNMRNARVVLLQRGLEMGRVDYQFSDYYPKDTIISQSIQAGKYVPYGSRLDIVISKGSETQSIVPTLIGYSFEEIHSVLQLNGFVLGTVSYRASETYLPNTVIEQSPNADEQAAPGTAISIVVSK